MTLLIHKLDRLNMSQDIADKFDIENTFNRHASSFEKGSVIRDKFNDAWIIEDMGFSYESDTVAIFCRLQ